MDLACITLLAGCGCSPSGMPINSVLHLCFISGMGRFVCTTKFIRIKLRIHTISFGCLWCSVHYSMCLRAFRCSFWSCTGTIYPFIFLILGYRFNLRESEPKLTHQHYLSHSFSRAFTADVSGLTSRYSALPSPLRSAKFKPVPFVPTLVTITPRSHHSTLAALGPWSGPSRFN